MKDLGDIMKQAQAMQQRLREAQARLTATTVEGTAGGGMVSVTLTGAGELKGVALDETLVRPGEDEVIADLIVAAHADAKRKLDARQAEVMKEVAGPLAAMGGGLPGMPF